MVKGFFQFLLALVELLKWILHLSLNLFLVCWTRWCGEIVFSRWVSGLQNSIVGDLLSGISWIHPFEAGTDAPFRLRQQHFCLDSLLSVVWRDVVFICHFFVLNEWLEMIWNSLCTFKFCLFNFANFIFLRWSCRDCLFSRNGLAILQQLHCSGCFFRSTRFFLFDFLLFDLRNPFCQILKYLIYAVHVLLSDGNWRKGYWFLQIFSLQTEWRFSSIGLFLLRKAIGRVRMCRNGQNWFT